MPNTRPLPLVAALALSLTLSWAPQAFAQPLPSAAAAPPSSHPGERVQRLTAPESEISIVELQSRVVETEARIRLVDDFNPATVSVTALSPTQLRIRGEAAGITTVRVADEFDHVYLITVMVERDLRELEANLRRLFPGTSIRVVGVRDSVVLQGWVTQPSQIPNIVAVAQTYTPNVQNHLQVGGGNQIQLSCKVMEVQRSKLEALGFNFLTLGQNYYFASTPGALAPIAEATLPFGGPPTIATQAAALANPTAQFAILGSSDIFRGFIEALKQESLLKIVAEPNLVTVSGRTAEFHSGGEFPILVPQGVGTATIQFRDFGVRLEAVPVVLGNGRVQLDVMAEISERDFSNAVNTGGVLVPGLTSRDVNTRVEMNFGETVMIGGLTQDRVTSSTNKIPVLGDIPYLGVAFSRKNHQLATTELIIMVTPNLTAPLAPGQVPCNGPGLNSDDPTCKEFHLDAHMEVPRFSGGACPPGLACPPGIEGGYATPYAADAGYSSVPQFGGGSAAPAYEYAPGATAEGLQGQPVFPQDAGQPPMPLPGAEFMPAPGPVVPMGYPATGVTPATGGDYRSGQFVRPVAADDSDLAAERMPARPTTASPGLIEPGRNLTRPAPRFVGSGSTRP